MGGATMPGHRRAAAIGRVLLNFLVFWFLFVLFFCLCCRGASGAEEIRSLPRLFPHGVLSQMQEEEDGRGHSSERNALSTDMRAFALFVLPLLLSAVVFVVVGIVLVLVCGLVLTAVAAVACCCACNSFAFFLDPFQALMLPFYMHVIFFFCVLVLVRVVRLEGMGNNDVCLGCLA